MDAQNPTVPYGLCHCGCGGKAPISRWSHTVKGYVKGEPRRYIAGHHLRSKKPLYIEENRGYESPCWIWQRSVKSSGYGQMTANGKTADNAHRVLWEQRHGPVPHGLELDHLCRVKLCVNPDHLEPVTHKENLRRGPRVILNADTVRSIRASDKSALELALEFGVARQTIYSIRNRQRWKDVV